VHVVIIIVPAFDGTSRYCACLPILLFYGESFCMQFSILFKYILHIATCILLCVLCCTYFVFVIAVLWQPLLLIFRWSRYSKRGIILRVNNLSFHSLAVVYIIATCPVAATVAFSLYLLPVLCIFMFIFYTSAFLAYVYITVHNVPFPLLIWTTLLKVED
jgi:hypothetical protein